MRVQRPARIHRQCSWHGHQDGAPGLGDPAGKGGWQGVTGEGGHKGRGARRGQGARAAVPQGRWPCTRAAGGARHAAHPHAHLIQGPMRASISNRRIMRCARTHAHKGEGEAWGRRARRGRASFARPPPHTAHAAAHANSPLPAPPPPQSHAPRQSTPAPTLQVRATRARGAFVCGRWVSPRGAPRRGQAYTHTHTPPRTATRAPGARAPAVPSSPCPPPLSPCSSWPPSTVKPRPKDCSRPSTATSRSSATFSTWVGGWVGCVGGQAWVWVGGQVGCGAWRG